MKRTLALLAFLLLFSVFGAAQADSYFTCSLTAVNTYCPGSGGSAVLNGGIDTHNVYIVPVGTPGTITVLLQGSVIGDFSDAVTCGTSSTTTANLLTCSGIYTRVRVKLSVFTVFTTVNITYVGVSSVTKKGGGGGSGTVTSVGCTAPLVCSPAPITTTGTAAAPSLVALGSFPTCASIATPVLNGTITQGACDTQFSNTQINSLQVQGANTILIGLEPPSGYCTYATSFAMTYDDAGSPFVCTSALTNATFSLGYADQSGTYAPIYTNAMACVNFMDESIGPGATIQTAPAVNNGGVPVTNLLTGEAGEALTLANSGDYQTTGGAGSHVRVAVGFQVFPCP